MWNLPPTNLLSTSSQFDSSQQLLEAEHEGDMITDKLDQLGMRCEIEHIDIGPQVISYSCIAAEKVAVRKIPSLSPELQYELGCESISIHAPLPGSKYVVIEVANSNRRAVLLGDVINAANSPLEFPLGLSTSNQIIAQDIRAMPHCLVAGTTGSGKSTGLHSMICSLLMATTPDDLQFHFTDTKMVELPVYDGIPNLLCDTVTDAYEAVEHFKALVGMMEKRYRMAQEHGVKSLDELNNRLPYSNRLPYILVVVDEIADLIMLSKHEVEESIVRIAQKARAVGIHMILATQSPRREIVTGLLKANLPSRLGFSTSSGLDSRIIMDKMGCEKLIGNGDVLFSDQGKSPIRIQSPYVSGAEIAGIVSHWQIQNNLELAA